MNKIKPLETATLFFSGATIFLLGIAFNRREELIIKIIFIIMAALNMFCIKEWIESKIICERSEERLEIIKEIFYKIEDKK